MKENQLQAMFRNWLKANWQASAAFELKICKTDRFNLSKIAPHQILNLHLVERGLFHWKLPDLGLQNPFDCFTLYKGEAYVVVFFYKPRKPKKFYMIPIIAILNEIVCDKKSITEAEAMRLAYKVGTLK